MLSLQRHETLDAGLTRIARETVDHAVGHLTDSRRYVHARARDEEASQGDPRRSPPRTFRARRRLFRAQHCASRHRARARFGARSGCARGHGQVIARPTKDPLERRALTRVGRLIDRPAEDVDLTDLAARLPAITFTVQGTQWFERGLRRTYRSGRRAFREARAAPNVAAIHEWRKRVKDLWYEVQIIAPHSVRVVVLHDLSRLLGDHHDVFALNALVAENRRRFGKSRCTASP